MAIAISENTCFGGVKPTGWVGLRRSREMIQLFVLSRFRIAKPVSTFAENALAFTPARWIGDLYGGKQHARIIVTRIDPMPFNRQTRRADHLSPPEPALF